MTTPHFKPWKTLLEKNPEYTPETPNTQFMKKTNELMEDLSKLYHQFRGTVISPGDLNWIRNEGDWHCLGRPYYKVWPYMVDALSTTTMNFLPEFLESPFPVISVLLPIEKSTYYYLGANSVLVRLHTPQQSRLSMKHLFEEHNSDKILSATFIEEDGGANHIILPLPRDRTVEDSLAEIMSDSFPTIENATAKSLVPLVNRFKLWKVAIASMMFGVDNHQLLKVDVDTEVLNRQFPGGRSKASQKAAEERRQAALEKLASTTKGWRIGSEIDLPRSYNSSGTSDPKSSHELSHSFVRCGHMRMQPYGPKHELRKLIYVAPTLVRPDLPPVPTKGYRIR